MLIRKLKGMKVFQFFKLHILVFVNIVTMMLAGTQNLSAQSQANVYRYDKTFPFVVITSADVDTIPAFSDREFYEHSNSIIFEVNETHVLCDDPFFELYYTQLLPYINERRLQLRKVFVRGAASPEGPYDWNYTLGLGRSQELLTLLRTGLRHQYVKTDEEVSPITEDYGYLCILLRESRDPDYAIVQRIYDECNGDEVCCKERLMAYNDGKLWKRLIHEYFARLRAARFMLWFSEPDAEHAPAPVVQPARRDTIYLNDTIFVKRPVVVDTTPVVPVPSTTVTTPADNAPIPVYICSGRIHVGCIHDRQLHPAHSDTINRHPLFALKTNLLFDVATFLNAEVEVPIRKRSSIVAEVVWPWWLQRSNNRWCNEMGSVSLEGRWWFKPWQYHSSFRQWHDSRREPLSHGFIGAYIAGGYYDFQLPKKHYYPEGLSQYKYYRKGRQGEFLSAGVTVGVERYIGRSMRLEASLGLGVAYTEYRTYHVDANNDIELDRDQHLWRDEHEGKYSLLSWMNLRDPNPRSNGRNLWIGPTKAKLSLVWLITKPCRKTKKKGGAQ